MAHDNSQKYQPTLPETFPGITSAFVQGEDVPANYSRFCRLVNGGLLGNIQVHSVDDREPQQFTINPESNANAVVITDHSLGKSGCEVNLVKRIIFY